MKKILFISLVLFPFMSQAQKITQYKASNGVTYHVNDTVRLGRGSGNNGSFLYIENRGILPTPRGNHSIPREFTNSGLVIKSIKQMQLNGLSKYFFIVGAGGPMRFSIYIDDAISACEVVPCQATSPQQPSSVADEIKKLKDLLDSGAITKAEYEAQKKKLLGE